MKRENGEKKMNNKLKIGLLVLTVAVLLVAPHATALPGYVTPLATLYGAGLSCGECHVSPGGGGSLTAYGTSFAGQSKHMSDPTSALTAIGAPPGAASAPTYTPTPAPTSTVTTPAPTPVITAPAITSAVSTTVQTPIIAMVTSKNFTEEEHNHEKICEKDHHNSEVSEHDHDERVSEKESHDEKTSEENEQDED